LVNPRSCALELNAFELFRFNSIKRKKRRPRERLNL
jgi:hypothetical protein